MKFFIIFLLHFTFVCSDFLENRLINYSVDFSVYNNQTIESVGFPTVNPQDVTFRLWTRAQNETYLQIYTGQLNNQSVLNPAQPVIFIIHGFTDNANKTWMIEMMRQYLIKYNCNVILVDWSKPASQPYPIAAGSTRDVGKYIALLIIDLNQTLGVPFSNVHLVGHSLGSHISGFCGKYLKSSNKPVPGRITGLDPAGPLFNLATPNNRLNKGDATFVDCIHTDSGKLGIILAIGNVDFFPNGGTAVQPPCRNYTLQGIANEILGCSHGMSYVYFTESINSYGFVARLCVNFPFYFLNYCNYNIAAIMGENCNQSINGNFYLTTNDKPPFARNGQV